MNKLLSVFLVVLCSTLLSACKKDEPTSAQDTTKPFSITEYVGEWSGTTGQSLPVYFRIAQSGLIDSLTIRIRMSLPTFTCTATFTKDSVVTLQSGSFVVPVKFAGASFRTRVHLTFNSTSAAQGTYDGYGGSFSLVCGSTFSMGTAGSIISQGTLQITKTGL